MGNVALVCDAKILNKISDNEIYCRFCNILFLSTFDISPNKAVNYGCGLIRKLFYRIPSHSDHMCSYDGLHILY